MESLLVGLFALGAVPLLVVWTACEVTIRTINPFAPTDRAMGRAVWLALARVKVLTYWTAPLSGLVVVLWILWLLAIALGG